MTIVCTMCAIAESPKPILKMIPAAREGVYPYADGEEQLEVGMFSKDYDSNVV